MSIELKEKLYTSTQVADILGVSLRTLYRYMEAGKIESMRTASGRHRFTRDQILSFLNSGNQSNDESSTDNNIAGSDDVQNISSQNVSSNNELNQNYSSHQQSGNYADTRMRYQTDYSNSQQSQAQPNLNTNQYQQQAGNFATEEDAVKALNDSLGSSGQINNSQQTNQNISNPYNSQQNITGQQNTQAQNVNTAGGVDFYDENQFDIRNASDSEDLYGNDINQNTATNNASEMNAYQQYNSQQKDNNLQNIQGNYRNTSYQHTQPVQQNTNQDIPQSRPQPSINQNIGPQSMQPSDVNQPPQNFVQQPQESSMKYFHSEILDIVDLAKKVSDVAKFKDLEYAFSYYAGLSLYFLLDKEFDTIHFYANPEDVRIWIDELKLSPVDSQNANVVVCINSDIVFVPTKTVGDYKVVDDTILMQDLQQINESSLVSQFRKYLAQSR